MIYTFASSFLMLGVFHTVSWAPFRVTNFLSSSVPALHFASLAHGTAASWLVACYTCWWCRWSTSATTWLSARHVSLWETKPLAAPTGDLSWTLACTLWVSVATGQRSWPWEKNVILSLLLQQTWCKPLLPPRQKSVWRSWMLFSSCPLDGSMAPFSHTWLHWSFSARQ